MTIIIALRKELRRRRASGAPRNQELDMSGQKLCVIAVDDS
jgi:hypothetical protein